MTNSYGRESPALAKAEPEEVSALTGFDPARWQWESGPCLNRFGQIASYDICHPSDPGSSSVCVVASCFEGEQVARFIAAAPRLYAALKAAVEDATGKPNVWFFDAKDALAAAIATEAQRAETPQDGSVHEGAGPKDIAQPPVSPRNDPHSRGEG